MDIVVEQSVAISQILGEQNVKENVKYRPLRYVKFAPVENGVMVSNILTYELLFLSPEEAKVIKEQEVLENELVHTLIKKWFLVPVDSDDLALCKQVQALLLAVNKIYIAPKIQSFTILPTTDCNARCFYCYELGCSRKWMTEQTAEDVVKYILKNKDEGKITLRWFGGEPLYNSKVIDLICTRLKEHGVDYRSSMISNAYLFDEDMVKRAKELWKLDKIQITLDGTEEVYNKTKAYIYKDCNSPFKRVLNNVMALLKNKVHVNIRMNMDMHNVDDLFTLTDYLLEQFGDYNNIFLYCHLLYDDPCKAKPVDFDIKHKFLINKADELSQYITENSKTFFMYAKSLRTKDHCLADRDTTVMILPEGQLGKCEHFIDDHFIGSIYSDKIDFDTLNWFKEMATPMAECDMCDLRPLCTKNACCPGVNHYCSEAMRKSKLERYLGYLVKTHKYWKEYLNGSKI